MKNYFVVSLAVLVFCTSARAADHSGTGVGACVWAATPTSVRDVLLTRFADGSLELAGAVSPEIAQTVAQACHLPQTSEGVAMFSDALRANTAMTFALAGFQTHHVPMSKLEAVWSNLSPTSREIFSEAFSNGFNAHAAFADLAAAIRKVGLQGDELGTLTFDYVAARAVLERLD
jgi:hypothetical protein